MTWKGDEAVLLQPEGVPFRKLLPALREIGCTGPGIYNLIRPGGPGIPEGGEKMAVTATPLLSRLQLQVVIGTTPEGKPILRTRSYSNVKPDAGNEELLQTGRELANLQQHPLEAIRRVDEAELEEEE